jgi:hypothetical protein
VRRNARLLIRLPGSAPVPAPFAASAGRDEGRSIRLAMVTIHLQ